MSRSLESLDWLIVGYGRVGQTLALLADQLDARVAATWNRTSGAAERARVPSPNPAFGALPDALDDFFDRPRLIWLTVVDDAVVATYDKIADHLPDGSVVIHTSGSLPSTALRCRPGIDIASLHPLAAIADPQHAITRLADVTWSIEGDEPAVDSLEELVAPAGIQPLRIDPDQKALYHASAATAANLLVGLFDAACSMAEAGGLSRDDAHRMLHRLAESSVRNLAHHSPSDALTGPVARDDQTTIARHRRQLAELDDESLLEIYDVLTRRAQNHLVE